MAMLDTLAGPATAAVLLLAGGIAAGAQPTLATLVGTVRDSAGRPIPAVEVRFRGLNVAAARTNDSGGFRFTALPAGPTSIVVRRLGFAPATVNLRLRADRTDSLVVTLTAVATTIDGVLVRDEHETRSRRVLAGFWERRERGFGSFVTRAEIDRRDPHDFVDIARLVPSVSVQTRNGRKVIRFNRSSGGVRDCPPQYFVDGMRIESGSPDEFSPEDVEAVEIYPGPATTPPQFVAPPFSFTCGAVVIWMRVPG
jgi:hypothetical protein